MAMFKAFKHSGMEKIARDAGLSRLPCSRPYASTADANIPAEGYADG